MEEQLATILHDTNMNVICAKTDWELRTPDKGDEGLLCKNCGYHAPKHLLVALADYIQRATVGAVKNEIRHLVEGDEDGVVYSLEAIGRRAEERHKQLEGKK